MKKLLICFVLLASILGGCNSVRPGFISEESYVITDDDFDGPRKGHFDEDGRWIPDNKAIAWTYKIPDISAGFVFDVHSMDLTPSLQVELVEFHLPIPYLNIWKVDGGVAYQRSFIYFGPLLTNIFEISIGGFAGWNWDSGNWSYGPAISIISF